MLNARGSMPNMSKITIENMEFYAYHGHFEEEQKIGTWFSLDLTMDVDTNCTAPDTCMAMPYAEFTIVP